MSSENPNLRCSSFEDFSSDSKFWNWAYENVPTVTIQDISSGEYDDTYVCFDVFAIGAVDHDDWSEVHLVTQTPDGEYTRAIFTPGVSESSTLKYGEKLITGIGRNDRIKFFGPVKDGGFSFDDAIGIKNLGRDTSFDVDSFLKKENEKEELERKEREAAAKAARDAITNPLMKDDVKTGTIYSGDKSKILGSYGYLSISKEVLKTVTAEDLKEFALEKVKDNRWYNWVSIIYDDGTGITFAGCEISCPTYGKLDTDGAVLEGYGNIIWDYETETYSYESN